MTTLRHATTASVWLSMACIGASHAQAPDTVAMLAGSWSGAGRLHYTDGRAENIHCSAHYRGGGNELSLAIQCKSDSNPIHIRSKLRIDGGRASGDWEERTFNASGSASGSVSPGSLRLSVSGGGFNGTMTVTYARNAHSVVISTQGIAMSKATINFSR